MTRLILTLLATLGLAACVVAPPGRPYRPVLHPAPVLVAPVLEIRTLRIVPISADIYELRFPYAVSGGSARIARVCHQWPGGRPVCQAPQLNRERNQAFVRAERRLDRPQELEGWVEYESGGRSLRSNTVRATATPQPRKRKPLRR